MLIRLPIFTGYRRVTAEIDERHIVGRKFFQRCGFMFETILRKHRVIQNRNSNTALYVMLNSEWNEVEPKLRLYVNIPKQDTVKAIEIPSFDIKAPQVDSKKQTKAKSRKNK